MERSKPVERFHSTPFQSLMDRVNIGNQFQTCVSILFVTYCLFEVPSNLIIKRFKPAYYLAAITVLWGIVATLTGLDNNYSQMLAMRVVLGFFEAGLFPGLVVYLTMFYTKRTLAAIAGASGGLLAYAIGFMDGLSGLRGWRWIITIEGIPSVLTSFVVPFVLPNSLESARFFTEEDRRIVQQMHEREIGYTASGLEFHWYDVCKAFYDWTVWAYGVAHFCMLVMLYSFNIYLSTIINELGLWTVAETQALTIPIYTVAGVVYVCVARISDKQQQRGIYAICFLGISIFGYALLISNHNAATSFAGCFFVALGAYTAIGMPAAWLETNYPRFAKRAVGSATQLTMGNAAGVAAPFLFTNDRAPEHHLGYGVAMGLLLVSISIYIFIRMYWSRVNRRRNERKEDWKMEGKTDLEVDEMGDESPRFRFTL